MDAITETVRDRYAEAARRAAAGGTVVSVKWWKSVQRVIVRPVDYAARFTASMS
jgi:hypothetical protein